MCYNRAGEDATFPSQLTSAEGHRQARAKSLFFFLIFYLSNVGEKLCQVVNIQFLKNN